MKKKIESLKVLGILLISIPGAILIGLIIYGIVDTFTSGNFYAIVLLGVPLMYIGVTIGIPLFFLTITGGILLINHSVYYKKKESKYFEYMNAGGKKNRIRIIGLTKEGEKQDNIIIPERIAEKSVSFFGKEGIDLAEFDWKESVCKKLYMRTYISGKGFNTARTLEKIFVIDGKLPADISISKDVKLYVSSVHKGRTKLEQTVLPANISYNYNYEDSENYGVYFIDDCDYGSKIEYIPANPTREGYIFDGWYKEPECINKWNFESDTLPEEIKEKSNKGYKEIIYQETKLYAKWNH